MMLQNFVTVAAVCLLCLGMWLNIVTLLQNIDSEYIFFRKMAIGINLMIFAIGLKVILG